MSVSLTVDELCEKLINTIKQYHPVSRLPLIVRAYDFARDAHGEQLRKSGEPYIIHPLSVAIILAELELDLETIAAGILHDVIEDTPYDFTDIVRMFGEEVAQLVDGVTKLEEIEYVSKEEVQAENFRKMLLSTSKDIRVILIKIADRLHNMRTLNFRSENKQHDVATETLEVYAPLAHRLGIAKLRYELEDLCFRYSNPKAYLDLAEKVDMKQREREDFINCIVNDVKSKMLSYNIHARVEGRYKHFFSIYKKMIKKDKEFDEIYDLFAIRIIVDDVQECYEALGVLHEMYTPMPGRFKDYIGMPKANKYQSLHTTLMRKYPEAEGEASGRPPQGTPAGLMSEPFEVQIRTLEMHRVAEFGIAAHWKYKEGRIGQAKPEGEDAKYAWLREMLSMQKDLSDNKEFLEAIKMDMNIFQDHIYCFTPKGMLVKLITGATPIDFAYAVHSAVGNKMTGAYVNNKMVPFNYTLSNCDQVRIETSQSSKGPKIEWLKIVRTTQARTKINQWFKKENRGENVVHGREMLEAEAKRVTPLPLADLMGEGRLIQVLDHYNYRDLDTMYAAIGYGGIKDSQVINRLYREYVKAHPLFNPDELLKKIQEEAASQPVKKVSRSGIVVAGMDDANVRFSRCCSPLPGDKIVVYITRGRAMTLHRSDCVNIRNMDEAEYVRVMDAEWDVPETSAPAQYHTDLSMHCEDRKDLLNDIWKVITDMNISTDYFNVRTINGLAIFDMGVEVANATHLEKLCTKLNQVRSVNEVRRVTV